MDLGGYGMLTIRPITERDVPQCADIYNYYIENTTITFEEAPLTAEAFSARVRRITQRYPYLVAEEDGQIAGYAYLDLYNDRSAYRYTADLSIYLRHGCGARGLGSALLAEIERLAAEAGFRNIISIITEENAPSLAFHEKHGYRPAGRLYKVGLKFGRWLDVAFYQKAL